MPINTFKAAIKEDANVKKLRLLLKKGAFSIKAEARIQELKTMHTTRKVRQLKFKEVVKDMQTHLGEAVIDSQTTRSRAVEIKTACTEISMTLEDHLKKLTKFLKITYATQLRASGYTTVTAQSDAVNNIPTIANAYTHLRDIEKVIKICDLLIDDIDKSYFNLQLLTRVFEVSTRPERNL